MAGELLAGQGPAPRGLHLQLVLGLRRQQIEQVVAGFGTNSVDALELVGRGFVDCQQSILKVRDQDERVSAFHDISEQFPLGERLRHAAFQRLVQLAERASAFLRAVTSLAAPNHSVMLPFPSNSGTARDSVHPCVPSARRTRCSSSNTFLAAVAS